eukprot:CAMPEP_0196784428 /NCGR_PEP_ID=MMETSP1104-20130614/16917_1 /TAXON_ID=33652 /ORGANISM="Cafeteria sp., Strain Caron Lab Isolate" /LENGTH=156 /DNA_ID=CAMNT_0042154709 /DNA_START=114 /DNA_END=581 /DNA_ORIENTATION=+
MPGKRRQMPTGGKSTRGRGARGHGASSRGGGGRPAPFAPPAGGGFEHFAADMFGMGGTDDLSEEDMYMNAMMMQQLQQEADALGIDVEELMDLMASGAMDDGEDSDDYYDSDDASTEDEGGHGGHGFFDGDEEDEFEGMDEMDLAQLLAAMGQDLG